MGRVIRHPALLLTRGPTRAAPSILLVAPGMRQEQKGPVPGPALPVWQRPLPPRTDFLSASESIAPEGWIGKKKMTQAAVPSWLEESQGRFFDLLFELESSSFWRRPKNAVASKTLP